jgi:hypothetical protein
MFNPKSNNLLDDQLAVSGLEMNWVGAAIGAGTAIIGGIMGSQQASKQNAANRRAAEEQKRLAEKQAKLTNKYNKATFEAEQKDYFAARQFQYEMAVKQWMYDTSIQDYRYVQDLKAYGASVQNYEQQKMYNNIAFQSAKDSQLAAFSETIDAAAFEKQGMLVEKLEAEGRASMQQASRGKAMQAVAAKQGRDLAVLSASLTSSAEELKRSLFDTVLEKYGADMQAKANLMIKPDRLPELMVPVMGPAKTFIKPMKVQPAAVPPPRYTNPMVPLIGGISSAASTIAGVVP